MSARRIEVAVLAAFVVVFATLSAHGSAGKSGTFDEPLHLLAGYAVLAKGDFRVDPTHPPLARAWAAVPLLLVDRPAIALEQIDAMRGRDWLPKTAEASQAFLYSQNDGDRLLRVSRFMVVVLGVVLGLLIYAWTREWLGVPAAMCTLGFYALTPSLLAHSALVTTDVAVTLCMFATIFALWRAVREPTRGRCILVGIAAGLAIGSKFTALLLLPSIVILLGIAAASRESRMTWRRAVTAAATISVVTMVMIWAAYGFRYSPGGPPAWAFHVDRLDMVRQHFGDWLPVVQWIDTHRLLPNAFTHGFLMSQASAAALPSFLAGEVSTDGWWYYFPLAFLIKTPVVLLILFGAGVAVMMRRRRQLGSLMVWFVMVPSAVVTLAAMSSQINLGIRHLLPAYPFVLMAAGVAASAVLRDRRRSLRFALAAASGFWAVQVGRTHPDHLAYFNVAVGGVEHGREYLTDSNVDWGQDLKPLKQWMTANGVTHINLAYFGTADPKYYGIDGPALPGAGLHGEAFERPTLPGYVAVSATMQSGVYLPRRWRLFYSGFKNVKPDARIGRSIRVYWVDEWPEAPPPATWTEARLAAARGLAESLRSWGWHRHAAIHYERYVTQVPDDVGALAGLSATLITLDRATDALTYVDRARDRAPIHAGIHDLRGRVLAAQGRLIEAAQAFERSVTLDPAFAPPREALKALGRPIGGEPMVIASSR